MGKTLQEEARYDIMDAHVERLLANKVIGWVYHPDKLIEVLVEKDTGCEVQSSDPDYRPRPRPIDYPRELKIDPTIYRVEGFVFEGFVQHMYQDHKGNVTVGLGHMLKDADAAKKLPFYRGPLGPEGKLGDATAEDKEKEFIKVGDPKHKGKSLKYFLDITSLRLNPGDIEGRFKADVWEFIRQLRGEFTEFDTYPKMAQLGMLDLIYNIGYVKFIGTDEELKFKEFKKALKYRNWKEVAEQSHREEENDEGKIVPGVVRRNKIVREWFLRASEEDPFFFNSDCPPSDVSAIAG